MQTILNCWLIHKLPSTLAIPVSCWPMTWSISLSLTVKWTPLTRNDYVAKYFRSIFYQSTTFVTLYRWKKGGLFLGSHHDSHILAPKHSKQNSSSNREKTDNEKTTFVFKGRLLIIAPHRLHGLKRRGKKVQFSSALEECQIATQTQKNVCTEKVECTEITSRTTFFRGSCTSARKRSQPKTPKEFHEQNRWNVLIFIHEKLGSKLQIAYIMRTNYLNQTVSHADCSLLCLTYQDGA